MYNKYGNQMILAITLNNEHNNENKSDDDHSDDDKSDDDNTVVSGNYNDKDKQK